MAAPQKVGLDYYPSDVDMLRDTKLRFISALFGLEGEAILRRLLDYIYSRGYYAEWDNDILLLFSMDCPLNGKPLLEMQKLVREVVDELLKRGFFDRTLYDKYSILTSAGIQKRYYTATEKRTEIVFDERYFLLDKNRYVRRNVSFKGDNSPENGVISPENGVISPDYPQSKVKESKVKKSNSSGDKSPRTHFVKPTIEEVKQYCQERRNKVDAQRFVDYYTSKGWLVGKTPMKDWKAAVRTWERNNKQSNTDYSEPSRYTDKSDFTSLGVTEDEV